MKKHILKIHKNVLDITKDITSKKFNNYTEDDLDLLAESMDLLNDAYEVLYDNVFEEGDEK
jgi:hypothetical protein